MKTGFAVDMVTAAEARWGKEKYSKIKEMGFDCVDYQMADTKTFLYSLSDNDLKSYIKSELELAANAGLEINQSHGPWRWPPMEATVEDRAERMEKMKKSIYISRLLDCPNWIIHPIMPFGIEDIGSGNEKTTWDLNVEFMSELLKTAIEYDVTICYENMPMRNFSLATPEKVLEFARLMDNEHFKICLDTGHVAVIKGLSLGDEVRRLGDMIATLHIHDNNGSLDQHLFPYYGKLDWEDFSKSLSDINYSGVFSIESVISAKLPNHIYEEMGRTLNNISHHIIGK